MYKYITFCFSPSLVHLTVCLAEVKVVVTPKLEVIKGETVKLPCTYTTTAAASTVVTQWFIVSTFLVFNHNENQKYCTVFI